MRRLVLYGKPNDEQQEREIEKNQLTSYKTT